MSLEKLNRLVAELCGWSFPKEHDYWLIVTPEGKTVCRHFADVGDMGRRLLHSGVPNYAGSLDACAQFEAGLKPLHEDLYACLLTSLINPHRIDGYGDPENGSPQLAWPGVFQLVTATPEQRCLAFVQTVAPDREKELT